MYLKLYKYKKIWDLVGQRTATPYMNKTKPMIWYIYLYENFYGHKPSITFSFFSTF